MANTRPEIGFAVSFVSRFMSKPKESHMEAVFRILRYLKGALGIGLFFKKNSSQHIEVFTDADDGGSQTNRKSTSG